MKNRIFTFLTLFAVICSTPAQAGAVFKGLPMASDLRSDAAIARKSGRAIMVFFAAEYCGYCELVSELYLRPMLESGSHEDRILLRVIQTDNEAARLIGFDGKRTDHYNFATRNAASMTPTIKFYGPDG
ncbi:MAG: thioredoxin family protein, partial [Proteobacteria bacterium]|nr:thioredoxin family protein [Pseudomonadota bacterium]